MAVPTISVCEYCGRKFKFNCVPYRHLEKCKKEHAEAKKEGVAEPTKHRIIDPYKKKGKNKYRKEATEKCRVRIKKDLHTYFDITGMSGNERAMINRMLQESDEVIWNALVSLLKSHGIAAY